MLFKNYSTSNGSCYRILTLHILILSYQDMIKKCWWMKEGEGWCFYRRVGQRVRRWQVEIRWSLWCNAIRVKRQIRHYDVTQRSFVNLLVRILNPTYFCCGIFESQKHKFTYWAIPLSTCLEIEITNKYPPYLHMGK